LSYETILAKLDKKTRERVQKASEIEIVKHPYASLGLTKITGGGFAEGRIVLFYGARSTGKSAHIMQTVGQQQLKGKTVALIDAEGSYDPEFGARLGVNNDELIVNNAKSFAKAQEAGVDLIKAGIDILVIDSISNLIPDAFLDGEETKGAENQKQIGVRAKSTGILLNSLHYNNDKTAIFVISQARMQLGAMHATMGFEGGKAMEHAASQIIRLSASASESMQIKGDVLNDAGRIVQKPIGREVSVYVDKNKLGAPSGTTKYNFFYDGDFIGIDTFGETITLAVEAGVVEKGGAWLKYAGQQWQGAQKMSDALKSDLDLFEQIQKDVLAANE